MSTCKRVAGVTATVALFTYVTSDVCYYGHNGGYHLFFMPHNTYVGINRKHFDISTTVFDSYYGHFRHQRKIKYQWKSGNLKCIKRDDDGHKDVYNIDLFGKEYYDQIKASKALESWLPDSREQRESK